MSETPMTPVNSQESLDTVVYTNFGREHPGQFFNDAERGVQEAQTGAVLDLGVEDRPDPALWQAPEAPAQHASAEAAPARTHQEQLMESARSAGPDACVRYIASHGAAIHSGLREAA